MFKKLLDGELSLKDTFWKFGVVGLVFVNMLVRIFGSMLAQKLNGITILNYYRTYFNPLKMDSGMVLLTVLYLVSLGILLFYWGHGALRHSMTAACGSAIFRAF